MNIKWYGQGNPFKATFRKHYCYKCGTSMLTVWEKKIVDKKSPEAKYYDFTAFDTEPIGPWKFVHRVFRCPKCAENTEFMTQLSLEDIDICVEKTKRFFAKKGHNLSFEKQYELMSGKITDTLTDIIAVNYINLIVRKNGNETVCKVLKYRSGFWERPYYFELSKRNFRKYICRTLGIEL